MRMQVRRAGDVTVVDLHGRLTAEHGAADFRERVRGLLESGQREILLNLSGVTYLDSLGLESLVASYTTVLKNGGFERVGFGLPSVAMGERVASEFMALGE